MHSRLGLGPTSPKGFTLIEILVVILIVGITLSFALLAFGDFGEKRRIIVAAEQFNAYVQLVQQQAILETSTLGIELNKNGYQIRQLSTSGKWIPMSSRGIFHDQHFPKGLIFHLRHHTTKRGMPEIIINSSGDMTDFILDFGSSKQAVITTIIGNRHDI